MQPGDAQSLLSNSDVFPLDDLVQNNLLRNRSVTKIRIDNTDVYQLTLVLGKNDNTVCPNNINNNKNDIVTVDMKPLALHTT